MDEKKLINMIARGENSHIQFKADLNNANQLAAEIVAFSNTAGGRLLVGVNDDGSIAGLNTVDIQFKVIINRNQ